MDGLARRFEAHCGHLQAVAYRLLGSAPDAEDAVQEAWLRLVRGDAEAVDNRRGWLSTVVTRICVDMLRARALARDVPSGHPLLQDAHANTGDPEQEAALADSVGRALLVVLDRLSPVARVVFVLHEMFAVPFAEIAPIVDRTVEATKKIGSRARARLHGASPLSAAELARQRRRVEAFLAAARAGDVPGILAVLAPDVVREADAAALSPGRHAEVRGGREVSDDIAAFGRNAAFAGVVLVGGSIGLVVAPRGRLLLTIRFTFGLDRIAGYRLIGDPERLSGLDLAVLDRVSGG